MKQLLKNKDYMLYWVATTFSMAASNLVQFVLSLYVLALTGSATLFATMLAITFFPRLLLSPVSGVVGDRWPIKPTLIILGACSGLVLIGYGIFGTVGGNMHIGSVYVLVILLEVVETLYVGPSSRMIPTIVPKELLKQANALSTVDDGIVGVLTPMLGGLLYGAAGVVGSCFVAGGLFLVSLLLKAGINLEKDVRKKQEKGVRQNPIKDFTDGIKALKENSAMMKVTIIGTMINFFIAPIMIVINYFLLEGIKVSEMTYGLCNSIMSVVSIAVPILILPLVKKMNVFKLMPKGFGGIGMGTLLILFSTVLFYNWHQPMAIVLGVLLLGMGLMSIFATILNILLSAAFPYLVEEAYWGRVTSIMAMMMTVAIPLGQVLYGQMVDRISVASPLILAFLGCVASVLLARSMIKTIPQSVYDEMEKAEEQGDEKENAVLL
ncbi:MAG: MFS transporter [Clostridiales bacterium]|nr:MFS transporter [Clostridiales bacterium]